MSSSARSSSALSAVRQNPCDPALITIIGGSGFVGSHLVQKLARQGVRMRIGVRRPDLAGHLLPLGTVGQIALVQVNVRNAESVARAVNGASCVVNLAGIWHETGRQRFRAVHAMGAKNVARAAAAARVPSLIHVSELGADAESASMDLVSRALGDQAVLKAFPRAIVLRPGAMFGEGDRFFTRFGTWAQMFPYMPVIGAQHLQQPVFVTDVAEAIVRAMAGKVRGGKIYELGGPETRSMAELTDLTLHVTGRNRLRFKVPAGLARFKASFLQWVPNPWITVDLVNRWNSDMIVSEEAVADRRTLSAFGIEPETLEAVLPTYMWRFRRNGQFETIRA